MEEKKGTTMIVVGMAGSGKTTFVQRVIATMKQNKNPCYVINLDPATSHIPFTANIDIRDTINYKEVMKQYNLGPNGGIMTSLNLFATRFDKVLEFVEKKVDNVDYILIDTPGQIEVFNWSASGTIITESLASLSPTVLVYVVDTPRSVNPSTFMSNMLYACSILYKSKLPMVLVLNKIDVVRHEFAVDWMKDYQVFQDALDTNSSYLSSFTRSMSLVLDEFYQNLNTVGVSSLTGEGMQDFFEAVGKAAKEYETDYKAELNKRMQYQKEKDEAKKNDNLRRFKSDYEAAKNEIPRSSSPREVKKKEPETENHSDDDEKSEYDEFVEDLKAGNI